MNYIDADAVNKALDRIREETWLQDETWLQNVSSSTVLEYIEHHDAIQQILLVIDKERKLLNDAADVVPVRHGEWVDKTVSDGIAVEQWQSAKCSECGLYHTTPFMYYFDTYHFCPHCGAKMDGDADDAGN